MPSNDYKSFNLYNYFKKKKNILVGKKILNKILKKDKIKFYKRDKNLILIRKEKIERTKKDIIKKR